MLQEKEQAALEASFGGRAVGLKFNPSQLKSVTNIKAECAKLINDLQMFRNGTEDGEKKRMYSIAITELQTAQMWAIKALTWGGK